MGLLAASEEIRAEMVISAKDNASKQIKPVTGELGKALDALSKLMDKFDDLKKIDMSKLQSSLASIEATMGSMAASMKDISVTKSNVLSTGAGSSHVFIGDTSKYSQKELDANLRAQNAKLRAKNKKLRYDNAHYDELLENATKTAEAKLNNSEAHQKSADAYTIKANASKGWWEYRSEHPEKFIPLMQQTKYQAGNMLSGIGDQIKSMGVGGFLGGSTLSTLGKGIALGPLAGFSAGVISATEGIKKFTAASIEAFGQIESIKTQLSVVFGSESQSSRMFSELSEYAVKSPFGVEQTSEMAILLRQSGVYATDLLKTLRMIGDTAGGNMEKMKRIANNYAQIVSIGKASMLDMRQFAYAGIPIFKEVADYLGVSQSRLRSMISDGKVTAEVIEQVFKNMTGAGGIFENATAKGAETYQAKLQNLKDAKQLGLAAVGEWMTSWGSDRYNENSYMDRYINFSEQFYSGLQKWGDFKVLQKDVNAIKEKKADDKDIDESISDYNEKADAMEAFAKKFKGTKPEETGGYDYYNEYMKTANYYRSLAGAMEAQKNLKNSLEWQDSINIQYAKAIDKSNNHLRELYGMPDATVQDLINEYNRRYTERKALTEAAGTGIGTGIGSTVLGGAGSFAIPGVGAIPGYALGGMIGGMSGKVAGEITARVMQFIDDRKNGITKILDVPDVSLESVRQYVSTNQSTFEQLSDKLRRQSLSIQTIADEIKADYEANDEEYKKKQEEERKKKWEDTIKLLEEINSKTLEKSDYLDLSKVSGNQLSEWRQKGAINGDSLVTTAYGGERFLDSRNITQLLGNSQWAVRNIRAGLSSQFSTPIFDSEWEKTRKDASSDISSAAYLFISTLENLSKDIDNEKINATDAANSYDVAFKKFSETLQKYAESDAIAPNQKTAVNNFIEWLNSSQFNWTAVAKDLKMAAPKAKESQKDKSAYTDLWKRILESATGIKAEYINTGTQFMELYKPEVSRNIAQGGINALVSRGAGFEEIGNRMVYTRDNNEQDVLQIDWNRTAKRFTREALSMSRGLEETSAVLQGLSSAFSSQQSQFDKLKQTMLTTGEDWGTIDKIIKGEMTGKNLTTADRMDNAFQSISPKSNEYTLGYDDKEGITVLDKSTGKLVDSLKNIRTDAKYAGSKLKDFADSVKMDNVIKALDRLEAPLKAAAKIISANNSLQQEVVSLGKTAVSARASSLGGSYASMGMLRRAVGGNTGFTTLENGGKDYATGKYVSASLTKFLNFVAELDTKTSYDENADELKEYGISREQYKSLTENAEALQNGEDEEQAVYNLMIAFKEVFIELIDKAKDAADAEEESGRIKEADQFLNEGLYDSEVSLRGRFINGIRKSGGPVADFINVREKSKYIEENGTSAMTKAVMNNPGQNEWMLGLYGRHVRNALKGTEFEGSNEEKRIVRNIEGADYEGAKEEFESLGIDGLNFDNLIDGANKFAMAMAPVVDQFASLSAQGATLIGQFASSALTSSLSTMGENLAQGNYASKGISDNIRKLGAGLLQNMGTLMTEAGLSMIISAGANKAQLYAGLALAAAGGSLSFLGGYYGADNDDDNDTEDEYQRLQAIKEDLTELLKQAREDSIYYEKTARHKNAISANEGFKTQKVNDAIITPSGNVISTAPDDYLIATKTPGALAGGGAPTVNFSVIDKSTGIKVTQQSTRYNEDSNTFDFEAVIESKVQEVIATSKGDSAFNMREARLRGRTLVM